MANQHSVDRVERACERALTYTSRPTLKIIQTIIKTGQDKIPAGTNEEDTQKAVKSNPYGFTRGADYYGGKK